MTWGLTEREAIRLLDLSPKRERQLKRLGLVRSDGKPLHFRELVGLRVAKGLLEADVPVRRVRRLLRDLERFLPDSPSPLAELRVVAQGKEILIEEGALLLEPGTGQTVITFDVGELAESARASAHRGLIRPLVPRASQADFWFQRASEWEDDPATWEEAVSAYEEVLKCDPHYAAAWNNLGLLRHRLAEYDLAGDSYRRALDEDPACANAAYNLGVLAEDLGDTLSAIFHYRQALGIDPDYADAHFNLAGALERGGRNDEARGHWSRYLELDPESRWAKIARSHLGALRRS